MLEQVLGRWELVAGCLAAFWAIATFYLTRRWELAWNRTLFIMEQSSRLDDDEELRTCTLVLYGMHPTFQVDDFLRVVRQGAASQEETQFFLQFEKYLNFLWRIAYAHVGLRTLPLQDLCAFGVYFRKTCGHAGLRKYCQESGYDEIVTVAGILARRDVVADILARRSA